MYNLIEIKKMKKVLFAIVMVGALVAACNNSTETTTVDSTACDTVKCDSMKCETKCDSTQCDSTCEVKK
jgi:nitrous oxide reductase accessory protein NosL